MTRAGFGRRLTDAVRERGPLCVGIDPHPGLLTGWGLTDDVRGLEIFALGVVDALGDRVAVLKPQVAFFERHGSAGIAVLERVLAAAASTGALTIADAKRGDIGSTMDAYADAFLGEGSPLAADAMTVSPYLGFGSLAPVLSRARATGRGALVLALTSNPEGRQVQHARGPDGRTVAQTMLDAVHAENAADGHAAHGGSFGVVVGATVGDVADVAPRLDVGGPILAPGIGVQGAGPGDLRSVFGAALPSVLPSVSREVLRAGEEVAGAAARERALRAAARRALDKVLGALATAAP
ncbi:MAG: orotidine-5'-phosphate decarboxylase [Kineosporiaceae bacterium]